MKKVLMTLTLSFLAFFSMVTVDAATKEEVNLKELKNDSMIIGNRIYDTNYMLSLYDIVAASSEYAAETGSQAPVYVYVVDSSNADNNFIIHYTGPVKEDGTVPMEIIRDVEEVYPDSKLDATAINNSPVYEYITNIIEPEIIAGANELNQTAADKGFYSIEYNAETNTAKFNIKDLNTTLSSYKDSGIVDIFTRIISGSKSLTYTVNGETYGPIAKKDMDESSEVIALAQILLQQMSGKTGTLLYADVANTKASATVTYEYDGFEHVDTFYLEFVYDIETEKDKELVDAAIELNNQEDSGFYSIEYDTKTNTGTFNIVDLTKTLSSYKDSGIVSLFTKFIKDAKSLTYTVNGQTYGPIAKADMDESSEVIALAQILLQQMTGKTNSMVYGDAIDKTASATVIYEVEGKEYQVTYTLEFKIAE